jgi:hypothetical protein
MEDVIMSITDVRVRMKYGVPEHAKKLIKKWLGEGCVSAGSMHRALWFDEDLQVNYAFVYYWLNKYDRERKKAR